MRKNFLWLVFAVCMIALWMLLANLSIVHAQAPTPAVSLSVTPTMIEITSNQQVQLVVVATIPITTVRSISLTTFTDLGIVATVHDPARTAPPLRGSLAWSVDVKPAALGPKEGTLYFRADYMQESDGVLVPGVAFTQVTINDRDLDPLNTIVDAQIDTALETLKDQQTGQAYLRISNLSDVPVTITKISPAAPPFLKTTRTPNLPLTLQARQTRALEYQFTATDAIVPGKHLLVFEVEAEWERNARRVQGSLVLTRTLNFEVIGQEFLTFAQIPSLLLLPGILLVTTFIVLHRRAFPQTDPGLDFTKPEFWLGAVLVSMLALLIYTPLTTGLANVFPTIFAPRNYLQAYGLRDLIGLWLGAMFFGLLTWAVWGSALRYREHREQIRLKGLQVNQVDTPAEVLRVLANHKVGFNLPSVRYVKQAEGQPAQTQNVFRLPVGATDPSQAWIIPQIRVFWQKPTDERKNEQSELSKAILDTGNPRGLASVLDKLSIADAALVEWDQAQLVPNPTLVMKTELAPQRGVADPLVNDA